MQAILRSVVALALLVAACASPPDQDVMKKVTAHRDLGALYLQRGQPELAILEYRKALQIYQGDAEAHFGLGEAYRRKGEFELAEEEFLRALQIRPELLAARQNLGALYIQQKRWADAVRETQALLEDPTFLFPARALVNLGSAHYQSGDLDAAAESLRRAIAIEPNNAIAHLNLGKVSQKRGELAESISEFEAAIRILARLQPGTYGNVRAETRFRLAEAHARLGQRTRAIEHLQAAVETGGESEWGRRSRDFLRVLQ